METKRSQKTTVPLISPRLKLTLALLCAAGALALGIVVFRMEWVPAAPFDILGFLWLLTNLPRLILGATALGFAVLAVYLGVSAILED